MFAFNALWAGWISPVDEQDAPLVQSMNGYLMMCLQIEEKILPPIVVRQELIKKLKKLKHQKTEKLAKEKDMR